MNLQGAVNWLTSYRIEQGVLQREVAQRAGVVQSVISVLENTPVDFKIVRSLEQYAKALGYKIEVRLVPLERKK